MSLYGKNLLRQETAEVGGRGGRFVVRIENEVEEIIGSRPAIEITV